MTSAEIAAVTKLANTYWRKSRECTTKGLLNCGREWMCRYEGLVSVMEELGYSPIYNKDYDSGSFDGWLAGWRENVQYF